MYYVYYCAWVPAFPTLQLFYAPRSQLNFLQLLHSKAEQSVTVMCRGAVVYYDNKNNNFNSATQMLLFNGKVIDTHLDRRVRGEGGSINMEVNVKDDCSVRPRTSAGIKACNG